MSDYPAGSTPQFGTAEYGPQTGGDRCQSCQQPITGQYYRVSGALACPACAQNALGDLPKDTHKAFGRGLLFAFGGAFLGLILYSAVGIITGLEIGYVSLAVGFLVGKAMMMGSWGIGGRRYQIAALVLTYAAVSMSAVPIGIAAYVKNQNALNPNAAKSAPPSSSAASSAPGSGQTSSDTSSQKDQGPAPNLGALLLTLVLLGLASPFLELQSPVSGLIGLVILFVGIQIAWKITAGQNVEVLGPFQA